MLSGKFASWIKNTFDFSGDRSTHRWVYTGLLGRRMIVRENTLPVSTTTHLLTICLAEGTHEWLLYRTCLRLERPTHLIHQGKPCKRKANVAFTCNTGLNHGKEMVTDLVTLENRKSIPSAQQSSLLKALGYHLPSPHLPRKSLHIVICAVSLQCRTGCFNGRVLQPSLIL